MPTELAIATLAEKPYLGGYEAICVDEFQDIAGNPLLLKVVLALAGTGSATNTEIIFAGDESQQILRPNGEHVSALAEASALMPDLVHLRLRTNCRIAPGLSKQLHRALKIDLQLTVPSSSGKVGWRSIFKFKGLEADAVIITDLNPAAVETMRQRELDLDDLLYVGMTRAKYRCVVLDSEDVLARAGVDR